MKQRYLVANPQATRHWVRGIPSINIYIYSIYWPTYATLLHIFTNNNNKKCFRLSCGSNHEKRGTIGFWSLKGYNNNNRGTNRVKLSWSNEMSRGVSPLFKPTLTRPGGLHTEDICAVLVSSRVPAGNCLQSISQRHKSKLTCLWLLSKAHWKLEHSLRKHVVSA